MQPPRVGSVVRVGSGRVDVVVTTDELNVVHEDRNYRVGQLGSYVTITLDDRTLVGFVIGAGRQDQTAHGVNPPLIMHVQLLGEIINGRFSRGVNEYPIVGDEVWVAVRSDFQKMFGSFEEESGQSAYPQTFSLGRFAFNQDFDIRLRGSAFLAKHVGIMGNSGSGKSCTTTRLLQELLDLRESQVVLFDMHGEYRAAFSDEEGQLNANVTYLGAEDLVLPYWLLRYEEMESLFIDRSNPVNISTQISFLRTAMLEYKQDAAKQLGLSETLTLDTPIFFSLEMFKTYAENLNDARFVVNDDHLAFSQLATRSLDPEEQQKMMRTQRCQFNRGNPEGETPHPLYFGKLLGLIDRIDTLYNDRRFEFMLRPIEHGMNSPYFRDYLNSAGGSRLSSSLLNHLIRLLTGRVSPRSNMTIIDLSGIPFEIVDITVAVLTRLLFDVNFWTPPKQRHPILLVFEEAHNYIPRHDNGQQFAKKAVERVAKEGRKYGVSAMVISQRPSELSETVLAQCNNFVVLRMSNPEDQRYVQKVVGDQFAGVIDMLPVLRPGECFVIGDSVMMPMRTLVEMPSPEPMSGDADFFRVWSQQTASSDIDEVINHWRRQDRQALTNAAVTGMKKAKAPTECETPNSMEPAKPPAPASAEPRLPRPRAKTAPEKPWTPFERKEAEPEQAPPAPKKSKWLVGG